MFSLNLINRTSSGYVFDIRWVRWLASYYTCYFELSVLTRLSAQCFLYNLRVVNTVHLGSNLLGSFKRDKGCYLCGTIFRRVNIWLGLA